MLVDVARAGLLLVVVTGYSTGCAGSREAETVRVFAAASLETAMASVAARYQASRESRIIINAAATSVLARQIGAGAEADIFVAANQEWMDWLEDRDLIHAGSRSPLLGNTLVMVAPRGRYKERGQSPPDCMALGQVDAVPAGIYAKAALIAMDWWPKLSGKVVETADVRAVLALVERGECEAGVVYASDVTSSDRIARLDIVMNISEDLHPPIVYPAAMVSAGGSEATVRFFEFLQGDEAAEVFSLYGFRILGGP